jgi:group I intron endonuclease
MIIPKNFGLKISGIYKITNIVNNKFYIGSSVDIYHRLKHHYSDLKNNKHGNKYFLRSYIKYGKNNFNVEILEEVPKELLLIKEQYYKDLYKNTNDFIILNSYECYLNINSNSRKEYNNIYSKTPKRQEYLKNYYRLYKNKINNIENTNNI